MEETLWISYKLSINVGNWRNKCHFLYRQFTTGYILHNEIQKKNLLSFNLRNFLQIERKCQSNLFLIYHISLTRIRQQLKSVELKYFGILEYLSLRGSDQLTRKLLRLLKISLRQNSQTYCFKLTGTTLKPLFKVMWRQQ